MHNFGEPSFVIDKRMFEIKNVNQLLLISLLVSITFLYSCSNKLISEKGKGISNKKEFKTQGDYSDYMTRKAFRFIKRNNYTKYRKEIVKDTSSNALVFQYGESGIAIYKTDSIYSNVFLSGEIHPNLLNIDSNNVQFVMIKRVVKTFRHHHIYLRFIVFLPNSYTFQNVYIELTNRKINNKNIEQFLKKAEVTYVKYGHIEI